MRKTDEAVALDSLRALGFDRVTMWNLRCVEAFQAQRYFKHEQSLSRLRNDIILSDLDAAHFNAILTYEQEQRDGVRYMDRW